MVCKLLSGEHYQRKGKCISKLQITLVRVREQILYITRQKHLRTP
uniref:Uncharacterized protein n=1 Tax=Rhizophora mucronata TaxID=61149 RepID=A0A2P2P444_RHIMU